MIEVLQDALRDGREENASLLRHLGLLQEIVGLEASARSLAELCDRIAAGVVRELGMERVAVFADWLDDVPAVVAVRDQDDRFAAIERERDRERERAGNSPDTRPAARELRVRRTAHVAGPGRQSGEPDHPASVGPRLDGTPTAAADLLPFAAEVYGRGEAIRWGGGGTGIRRPRPSGLDRDLIGVPLLADGECLGALVCTEITGAARDLVSQRALELVGRIIGQVVGTAQSRLAMLDAQNELERALGASRNRLRRHEESLRHESQRVAKLVSELGRSRRAKDRFLGLLSHELRTPLGVMVGFASLLHDGLAGALAPEQREILGRLLANGFHLESLIDDMLLVADARGARIQPILETVELPVLVADALAGLGEVPTSDTRLSVSIAPAAHEVRTDRRLLRRTLRHLLSNAVKFTPAGRIRVEAERDPGASEVRIRVIDTGVGIPAEQQRRIFEIFEKGDHDPDGVARSGGVGLGLSVVNECLRILEGHLEILAEPSGGTRVEIWIPDVPSSPATTGARTGRRTGRPARGTTRERAASVPAVHAQPTGAGR